LTIQNTTKTYGVSGIHLVIVGAFHGRGKRAETYRALLLAAYNPDNDTFETITKCGTCFTDKDLENCLKPYRSTSFPVTSQGEIHN